MKHISIYTFNGLTPNTAYKAGVEANCWGTPSAERKVEVRTTCEDKTIPYEEDFEVVDDLYCWIYDGFRSFHNASYTYSGEYGMYIYIYESNTDPHYAILPSMNTDISELMMNFWWSNYYAGYDMGTLYIGYLTDVDNYSTFVTVGTIDMSNSSNEYTQSINYLFTDAPTGSRIAFKCIGGDYAIAFIDDITVAIRPNCMDPYDLSVSDHTAHGATFEWTNGGSETAWQLYVSENNVEPADDETNVIDADANTFTLTSGLDPETTYYAWVRANCGSDGKSSWVGPETFTTTVACPVPTGFAADHLTGHTADLTWTGTAESYTVKYRTKAYFASDGLIEDFEGGAMPEGWTKEDPGTWIVGKGDYTTATGAHGGDYNAKITHGTTDNETYLVTPNLDLSGESGLNVNLWYINSWHGMMATPRIRAPSPWNKTVHLLPPSKLSMVSTKLSCPASTSTVSKIKLLSSMQKDCLLKSST